MGQQPRVDPPAALFGRSSLVTTFEHALLGINGVLAAGLHRQHGWQIAAVAGVAAVGPDWDGLPILFSVAWFDAAHRVWGHNVFACVLLGIALGVADYRFDLVTRAARFVGRFLQLNLSERALKIRRTFRRTDLCVWVVVSVLAALSQLPADLVVSGTATLNDWELQLFWPISRRGWVFPLIPWGDIGVTLIFVAGMFGMLRWKTRVQQIACLTLSAVVGYLLFAIVF